MISGVSKSVASRFAASLLAGLVFLGTARAADLRAFVGETQQSTTAAQQFTLVWWIPVEFWDLSLAANPNVPTSSAAQIREVFHDYQVFALIRATMSLQGLTGVATRADLLANARLEIDGKATPPLDADKVPPGVQAILGAMKPMLAGIMGPLGQSIELVVYPAVADGHRLMDPMKPGSFQYALYDQTFHWRLPLASLLPKKWDPKSKEEFPGNYDYNPFTGDKLSAK
jgi:hypothetical protein